MCEAVYTVFPEISYPGCCPYPTAQILLADLRFVYYDVNMKPFASITDRATSKLQNDCCFPGRHTDLLAAEGSVATRAASSA